MNLKINFPSSNSFEFYATNTYVPIQQHTYVLNDICVQRVDSYSNVKITEQLNRRIKLSNITMHILQYK